jgi:hypothetical protein
MAHYLFGLSYLRSIMAPCIKLLSKISSFHYRRSNCGSVVRFLIITRMQPIHTVNSRSHIMLEMLRDDYGLAGARMKREIQRLHGDIVRVLAAKNIDYGGLRAALVPAVNRHEATLVFNSRQIGSNLYGREIFNRLLPLLDPRTTQSILVGDLLGDDQQLVFEILSESMVLARSITLKHATLLYGVYINNLTEAALARLHQGLGSFDAYLGYIQTTYLSRAKIYVSISMASFLLKNGKTLIMAHEDYRPNSEDINITTYHLNQCGYKVASLQSMYFSIFLAYKIELPVFKGDDADVEISLNAIAADVRPLKEFTVLLDEAKHGYLLNEKLGKLQKAGLAKADRSHIESIIQAKVSRSYIYNLQYLDQHDVMKFNIMLEIDRNVGHPTRMTAALEYMPDKKTLRVITLH